MRAWMMVGLALASPVWGGEVMTPIESGGVFLVPTMSLREARFASTLRQKYDFSCGSAALATLLTHHYQTTVNEQDVFSEMLEHGDAQRIAREGFSLLDMKNFLARRGFEADGFVASVDALVTAKVPAIALIQENGYHHFVVVKGVQGGRVLLGDPSVGTRAMSRAGFEKVWVNRVLFVVRNRTDLARFNQEDHWKVAPSAPIGTVMQQGAADMMLIRRGPNDH